MPQVNGKMIALARESRGLSQAELSKELGIQNSTLCKMEYGSITVSETILTSLTAILNYPPSFFYQDIKVVPPNIHYRKRLTLSTRTIRKADAIMNIYRSNIDSLLKSIEFITPEMPIIDESSYDTPRKIAKFMRGYWGIERGPINELVTLVEKFGIIVVMMDYETDKIDGRSMISDSGHPIIFLNKNLSGDRQRLTLAHELGHIIMHMRSIPTFARDEESEAFDFAAEFLMPSDEIKHMFPSQISFERLFDMKRFWRVSIGALIMHAERLGRISTNQSRYLWSQYSKNGYKRTGEPIPIIIDSPSILNRLISVFKDGHGYKDSEMANTFYLNSSEYNEKYGNSQKGLRLVI